MIPCKAELEANACSPGRNGVLPAAESPVMHVCGHRSERVVYSCVDCACSTEASFEEESARGRCELACCFTSSVDRTPADVNCTAHIGQLARLLQSSTATVICNLNSDVSKRCSFALMLAYAEPSAAVLPAPYNQWTPSSLQQLQ